MRDLDLNDLRVFVRVVDRGGFAVAARELGVPTSTVSRAVARLEASTGTRLLHRTPRSLRVTREGRSIHASVRDALGALDQVAHGLEPASRVPKGVLRVSAPGEIAAAFLSHVAVAFSERYPLIQIELSLTNRPVNLVGEGFDLAIRAAPRLVDSTLVVKKLGVITHALFASRRYLDAHGTPTSPAELANHRCLVFRAQDLAKEWKLCAGKKTVEIMVRGAMAADDFSYLRAAAVAGGGIALLPRIACTRDIATGALVRVLAPYQAEGAGLFVLYPSARHVPARVAAFRDFLAAAYAGEVEVPSANTTP